MVLRKVIRNWPGVCLAAALSFALSAGFYPVLALEVPAGEQAALDACEKRVCTMILKKETQGGDLTCDLTKTWAKETLKGGESTNVKWGFGDAQCKTSLELTRADVIAALTKSQHTIKVSQQAVSCSVEREGQMKPVTAVASPRLDFKNGKAEKVWINLEKLEGPADIKGTIWTTAQLEDTLGIFHKSMIKQINKFMYKKCSEKYGPGAAAYAAKEAARAKAKAAKEAKAKAAAASAEAKAAVDPAAAAKSQAASH